MLIGVLCEVVTETSNHEAENNMVDLVRRREQGIGWEVIQKIKEVENLSTIWRSEMLG